MNHLIDGKRIAAEILDKTATRVAALKAEHGITPTLAVVLVGEDKPSQTYVRRKGKAAEKVGMDFALHTFPADIKQGNLLQKLHTIQDDPALTGLIVQLPLPDHLDEKAILNVIRPDIDVDCLTYTNLGKLVMKSNTIVPPTPGAVLSILKDLEIPLVGKEVTIVGVGPLVGKPLAIMMMNERATVSTCNSKTRDTADRCRRADIVVTGVGKKHLLTADMVKEGSIVIDTGVDFEDGKMYGDVHVEAVTQKAAWVTPTPGGVGPITVARLLWNTVICTESIIRKRTSVS